MFFKVQSFPKCKYHLFLSHSREDHDSLVRPVYDALNRWQITSFLDVEDYPLGRDSRSALKVELLLSRHVVFFITEAMVASPRGWCILELAYSEILQSMMQIPSGHVCNYILPLFLVTQSNESLPRSVWQLLRDRGVFVPDSILAADLPSWVVQQVAKFLRKERDYQLSMARLSLLDPVWKQELRMVTGRFDRATKFHPSRIALPDTP